MNKEEFKRICDELGIDCYFDRWDAWWKASSEAAKKQFDDAMKKKARRYINETLDENERDKI